MQTPAFRESSGREFLQQRAIGIRILADAPGQGRLLGVVTDMLARVVANQIELKLESFDEAESFAQILSLVDDLGAQIGTDERLVGVGLEIGGHVYQGRVVYSANAKWGQLPLEDRLTDVLRLPVVLENDANALAIYERRFEGIPEDSLAVVLLTHFGVGCGLILDGQVYRGIRGMAGEVGHVPIVGPANGGPQLLCRCGNDGCLECVATPSAIEENLKKAGFEGDYEDALRSADVDEVGQAFKSAGAALGRAVATIINLLNPSAIIFYGPSDLLGQSREFHIGRKVQSGEFHTDDDPSPTGAAHHYAAALVEAIRGHAFSTGPSDCRFIVRNSVDIYGAQAAAACLINKVLPAARVSRD